MQVAWQRRDEIDVAERDDRSVDYTPSGVYRVGRKRPSRRIIAVPDPFIVVQELDPIEAAEIALLELEVSEEDWGQDEITHSYGRAADDGQEVELEQTFELMPPVTIDAKLPIVGDAWSDEEETTRFERGVPVLLPRAFEPEALEQAEELAEDFELAATGEFVLQRFSSPWADDYRASIQPAPPPERTLRGWMLIAALVVAAETLLLATLAVTLG